MYLVQRGIEATPIKNKSGIFVINMATIVEAWSKQTFVFLLFLDRLAVSRPHANCFWHGMRARCTFQQTSLERMARHLVGNFSRAVRFPRCKPGLQFVAICKCAVYSCDVCRRQLLTLKKQPQPRPWHATDAFVAQPRGRACEWGRVDSNAAYFLIQEFSCVWQAHIGADH